MPTRLEELCVQKGLKMTEQRRVISRVLSEATDHPDVEQVYRRAVEIDPKISIATVYRTVRLFEEANVIERLDFGDGRSRFEENREEHHHHLIDLQSGEVIEFVNEGYELIGHRLELYGIPTNRPAKQSGDK
jgi:Fur family transcriptional regulator, ferric uptake regulator